MAGFTYNESGFKVGVSLPLSFNNAAAGHATNSAVKSKLSHEIQDASREVQPLITDNVNAVSDGLQNVVEGASGALNFLQNFNIK
jgi:hypothetical protein